jgi:hypothetical protein
MGHSLNRTSFKINNSLTIIDGQEKVDHILISDSKGVGGWRITTDYVTAKPNSHYIGELFGGGVVVAVWMEKGIERCLIAGMENISTISTSPGGSFFNYGFPWSNIQNISSGAIYKSFGASNSSIISVQSATSSGQKCLDYLNPEMGTGVWDDWYLPSIHELNQFVNNAAIFNKVLDSYVYDNNLTTSDITNTNVMYTWPDFTPEYSPISTVPSNINLFRFGPTKYTNNIYEYWEYSYSTQQTSSDADYYWSSTEDSTTHAWAVMAGTNSFNPSVAPNTLNLDSSIITKSTLSKIRPFRIADDTQIPFNFDADYAIITYKFSGEKDLDTRTTMVLPYAPQSESGYGSGYDGIGWTPDTATFSNSSTYSVVWHRKDNIGFGYETVLINFNAFKYFYPGQAEIIIDAKAHWYVNSWEPDFVSNPYDQLRLNETPPVVLGVDLYKGGNPIPNPLNVNQWINPTAGASMSLTSFGTNINTAYVSGAGTGQRVAKFKYNVLGKFGYLFGMD